MNALARTTGNPKPETRNPSEARTERGPVVSEFGIRDSAFFRISDFGFRNSRILSDDFCAAVRMLLAVLGVLLPAALRADQELLSFAGTSWTYYQAGNLPTNPDQPGVAWHAPAFDDSTWPSGAGLFGFEPDTPEVYPFPFATPLSRYVEGSATLQVITYFFRTQFVFEDDPKSVFLIASNLLDDGAAFYLNGSPCNRIRVNANATYNMMATGSPATEGTYEVASWPTTNLVRGLNTVAVELHQNGAGSVDAAFGLSLTARPVLPLVLTGQSPEFQSVGAGSNLTLHVTVTGDAPAYQWYQDGQALRNATNATLSWPSAVPTNAGHYQVIITNPICSVTSQVMVVQVLTQPLLILQQPPEWQAVQVGTRASLEVRVAGSLPSFRWYRMSPLGAMAGNNTNVLHLTAGASTEGGYYVVITNFLGAVTSQVAWLYAVPDLFGPRLLSAAVGETETDLLSVTFNEQPAMAPDGSPSFATSALNPANYTLTLLNSSAPPLLPASVIGAGSRVRLRFNTNWNRAADYLLTVNNVADFRGNLIAPASIVPVSFQERWLAFPFQSWWRFNDTVWDQPSWLFLGTNWMAPDYDDDPFSPPYDWAEGPAMFWFDPQGGFWRDTLALAGTGYGQILASGPATYFRQPFVPPPFLPTDSTNTTLELSYVVAGGVTFYLNGAEILRYLMPSGPLAWSTPPIGASLVRAANSLALAHLLVPGTNLLAAEVHSQQPTIAHAFAFDTQLSFLYWRTPALPPEEPPRLQAARPAPDSLRLFLTNQVHGFALEATTNLSRGPWLPIQPATTELVVPISGAPQYFRLRKY